MVSFCRKTNNNGLVLAFLRSQSMQELVGLSASLLGLTLRSMAEFENIIKHKATTILIRQDSILGFQDDIWPTNLGTLECTGHIERCHANAQVQW